MDTQKVHAQISSRLLDIFSAYQRGDDVPPAQLFHTEGFVEACCVMGVITREEAFQIMAAVYTQVFNEPLVNSSEQEFQIPALMKRAPVYPST